MDLTRTSGGGAGTEIQPAAQPRVAPQVEGMARRIAAELPYLRRYARALTGSQELGDRHAAATLEAMVRDRTVLSEGDSPKVALFRTFHTVWLSSGTPVSDDAPPEAGNQLEARAQAHLARLTPNSREALLLRTIEDFDTTEIARIMQVEPDEAERLIGVAYAEMEGSIRGLVMVIEDEPLIALDLHGIVSEMRHTVTGIARTRDQAVELGRRRPPDLILADIHLADSSSGIDAVRDLLQELGELPVIFITAYPDELLTGERPEPTFLITKPFSPEQVRSAVSQAMFFASTETLAG